MSTISPHIKGEFGRRTKITLLKCILHSKIERWRYQIC